MSLSHAKEVLLLSTTATLVTLSSFGGFAQGKPPNQTNINLAVASIFTVYLHRIAR